ncbi:Serine/threonine kinase SAD-1 [Pseudocercospora fuligena]|uniref:Serine/threonine kinase SAD-1 n=1 Tax=Pseudocercospora fuligena TaxID=685502 RepID=A0A8H6R891_9PEZI|nr:Serine/threonine kinase SAD-1 [Pseudocercospora fuligena]
MAAYDIQKHFSGLRVQTARRRGRPDPFATGFEDDSEEEDRKSRPKTKAPPVVKPSPSPRPPRAPSTSKSVSSPFAAIDAFRDSDDDFLDVPTKKRSDRRPSPAPRVAAVARVTDGAGRRGSLPGLSETKKAAALAAGNLAYLDDSSDDETFSNSTTRTGRGASPAPSTKHRGSDPTDGLPRSTTPHGTRLPAVAETSPRLNSVAVPRHTVASPFAGTKYLQDSDSDEEAVASRKGSAEEVNPDDLLKVVDPLKKSHEVQRVDKPKQNGSGVSWRAFSASRAEQRTAEIEALQANLSKRGRAISFCPTARTDDGRTIPLSPSAERQGGILGFRRPGQPRAKSPPRRAEDVSADQDEMADRESSIGGGPVGVYDPVQFKTNPFTAQTSVSPAHAFLSNWGKGEAEENATEPKPDDEGQSIGLNNEYIIGRTLNRGGFGVVKEVHSIDEHGNRTVRAVKIVRKSITGVGEAENEKAQQEVEHEVSIWRYLKHRHILGLHAVYETDFATFCVMDLNTGGTLFDLVRKARQNASSNDGRKGLVPKLAKSYAYQLACALRYLHEDIRVCHRDVKLENCLIDMSVPNAESEGGVLRLCDFGLADFLHSESMDDGAVTERDMEYLSLSGELPKRTASSIIGTLEYASPKGLSVHRKLFETAGDVWAFGVIIYALCTGDLPFRHAMPSKTAELILHAEWDEGALRHAAAGGAEVIDLVKGCLEKDIDLRFTIADALRSEWFEGYREMCEEDCVRGVWAS